MKITYSRKNTNRPILIYQDEQHVGNITRSLTLTPRYILELNGIYYSGDNRIRLNSGGHTGNWSATLQETYCKVDAILNLIDVKPYSKKTISYEDNPFLNIKDSSQEQIDILLYVLDFASKDSEPRLFLHCWMEGDWATIGDEWPDFKLAIPTIDNVSIATYEGLCKEWFKGCGCSIGKEPEKCDECTQNFLNAVKEMINDND